MTSPATSSRDLLLTLGGRNPSDVQNRRNALVWLVGGTYDEREAFALYGEVRDTAFGRKLYAIFQSHQSATKGGAA